MSIDAFHVHTKDSEQPFGEFRRRDVRVTIYRAPNGGFKKLDEDANIYEHLYLDQDTMTKGVIDKDFHIVTIGGHLGEICHLFQEYVYFDGMKKVLDDGDVRGASGQLGSAKVLVAEMCGYDRVMLEDNASWISFQLRPEAKNLYVLGCGGTLPKIRRLVWSAILAWKDDTTRQAFKSDREVSVI